MDDDGSSEHIVGLTVVVAEGDGDAVANSKFI